jgi:arsenate reductase (thioredoxin)
VTESRPPIRVLFVCTGNSARSQMAEAILGRIGGPDFEVRSAGTHPGTVNPMTIRALSEIGIDWSGAHSKSVVEFLDEPFDYVITVCDQAREACPVFPGQHASIHWGFDDPAAARGTDDERLGVFRRVMGEISIRLKPFAEVARRGRARGPDPTSQEA